MKIIWSSKAEDDLWDIFSYTLEDSPRAAEKVCKIILERIKKLATMPHLGRPGRVAGTKELVLVDIPYIIPYRVKQDNLEVLRIYHTSRKLRKKW
jgi:toxin ParE1/3/4